MTLLSINLESPNVKACHSGEALLTYEDVVEQIQEKIQVLSVKFILILYYIIRQHIIS